MRLSISWKALYLHNHNTIHALIFFLKRKLNAHSGKSIFFQRPTLRMLLDITMMPGFMLLQMKETNYITQNASSRSLIIIDELGRGIYFVY